MKEGIAGHNSTLAIGGVSSPVDSFVVEESLILRTNSYSENPVHRYQQNVGFNFMTQRIDKYCIFYEAPLIRENRSNEHVNYKYLLDFLQVKKEKIQPIYTSITGDFTFTIFNHFSFRGSFHMEETFEIML